MRKKNFKGKCEKKKLTKSIEVVRTNNRLMEIFAELLEADSEVTEMRVNVAMVGTDYTTDFVYTKKDGTTAVRECVFRKYLTKPLTVKLLDESRSYWLSHGITDWGIVIDEKVCEE